MTRADDGPESAPDRDPWRERTRAAVLNALVVDGLGIAASGLILRGRRPGIAPLSPADAARWAHLALLVVLMLGTVVRLIGVAPPDGPRGRRFYWSHALSAWIGTLALPIGLVYGWYFGHRLIDVGPAWVVALVLGLLALPRPDPPPPPPDHRHPGPRPAP